MMNPEQPTERFVLLVVAIVGSGALIGMLIDSLLSSVVLALIVGIVLNGYLLARIAMVADRAEKFPVVMLGAVLAGAYDGGKVFVIALITRFLAGLVR